MLRYNGKKHDDSSFFEFINHFASNFTNLESDRTENRNLTKQASDLVKQYNKVYRDTHHKKPTMYKKGEYVVVREIRSKSGVRSKLKPQYKEPYVFKRVFGNNRYVIADIPGFNLTSRPMDTILSSDRLKYWIKPVKNKN